MQKTVKQRITLNLTIEKVTISPFQQKFIIFLAEVTTVETTLAITTTPEATTTEGLTTTPAATTTEGITSTAEVTTTETGTTTGKLVKFSYFKNMFN